MHKSIGELKEEEKTLSTFLTSAAQFFPFYKFYYEPNNNITDLINYAL